MHQSWRYDLGDASHRARPSGLTELSNCLRRDRSIPILIGLLWRKFVDRLLHTMSGDLTRKLSNSGKVSLIRPLD